MHLAVCDDNIADRKQTERLLGRESDRIFKETGERIYIDSYGNAEAFLQNPQMYHGLFIDMTVGDVDGLAILKTLLDINIVRPIIMLCQNLDYRKLASDAGIDAPNVLFLDKPIRVAELHEVIDKIKELTADVPPTIELRGMEETIYAREEEIISAESKKRSEILIHLTGGRQIAVIGDIINFYDECKIFPSICPVNDYGLVNVNHVTGTSFGKVHLDNGNTIKQSLAYRGAIQKTRDELSKRN